MIPQQELEAADVARRIASRSLYEYVVSHAGRSQYSRSGGGVSSCGLAAMNCARIIFELERTGSKNAEFICALMKREVLEDVLRPCLLWSSPVHLDVDEIHKVPIFRKTLKMITSDFAQSGIEQFKNVLGRLQDVATKGRSAACAIITRPPEIIACFMIPTEGNGIFVIFDSHPRPNKHPHGAAFILNNSLSATASYIADLLKYDDRLLSDSTLQWQAQLLAHFSAHIFTSSPTSGSAAELTEATLQASLEVLSLRARVLDMESQNGYLTTDNERLSGEVSRLEDEVAELKAQARRARAPSQTQLFVQDRSYRNASRAVDVIRDSQSQKGKGREVYVPYASTNEVDSKQYIPPRRQIEGNYASSSRHAGSAYHDPMYDRDFALAAALQAEQMPSQDGAYAASMQREFDGEDARLKAQMTTLKHTAPGIFECGVCLEEFNVDVVARIDICGHQFCRTCILGHTAAKIDERRYPIVCPICMADKGLKKQGVVDDVIIHQLGLSERQYEVFVEMQLAAFSVILHCRKCKNTVFVDKSEHAAAEILVCPLQGCTYAWCKSCSQKIEFEGPKHSCDGSSELKHLMQQRGWKYCPGCKTPAEKIDGCNHMTCMAPGCNTHFCYVCGEAITQSVSRLGIKAALSAHYLRCTLFEDVA